MKKLTDEEFEKLWQQETVKGMSARLSGQFPAWNRRRRQRRNIAASLMVASVVGLSVWFASSPDPKAYDSVACNRSGYSDSHWLDVANDMLITEV